MQRIRIRNAAIKVVWPRRANFMHLILLTLLGCKPPATLAPDHCAHAVDTHVRTADGAEVALHRHVGQGPPVLIIHGISSNHRFWDLTEIHSLPVILADEGFDAWALDLRGHGSAMETAEGTPQRHGWTVDDYGQHDVDAAIRHIQAETGRSQVAVVGHSMGGMVMAAYHAAHGDDALAALVVVGSPLLFDQKTTVNRIKTMGASVGQIWRRFNTQKVAKAAAHTIPLPGEGLLYTRSNITPKMRRTMLSQVASPLSREELGHFQDIFKAGRFISADGATDYLESLATLDVPLLSIAGANDRVAPPDSVAAWTQHAGSSDETQWIMSEGNGQAADYGHLDLVLGNEAREDVLNPIVSWLEPRLSP